MKKNFIVVALVTTSLTFAQNTGVNTTAPTNTLDVNGTLRVRTIAETGNANFFTTIDSNGVLQKIKPSRIVATNVDQASGPVDVTVAKDQGVQAYVPLGLQNTITVPPGKKYGIILFYSIPMGVSSYAENTYTLTSSNITSPASPITAFPITYTTLQQTNVYNIGGYFGVGFYKNGILLPEPTRKVSIPKRTGIVYQMTTVAATYSETIDNTAGTSPISNTYQLQGYYEHYNNTGFIDATGGTIRFNMWSTTEPNYNWGRGTLSYILFELP